MRIGELVVRPDPSRAPFWEGVESDPEATARFRCSRCELENAVSLWAALESLRLPRQHEDSVATYFGCARRQLSIGEVWRSHEGRFPAFALHSCKFCGSRFVVYLAYDELSPLHYIATLQGVAHVHE